MFEVEVKARADHERIREELETKGAHHVDTVSQRDTYYDAPHRSFVETDEALRIRREMIAEGAESIAITYKGPRLDDSTKTPD
ncbi:MAG: class IV adenylate cyclase [Natrialbaceae archaeon]|nr:class IV adenylate cyclase [Natrialbaceae archaeon]